MIFHFFLNHRKKKLPTVGRVPLFSASEIRYFREEPRFVTEAVCPKTDYSVVRAYSDKYRTELPHKITLL